MYMLYVEDVTLIERVVRIACAHTSRNHPGGQSFALVCPGGLEPRRISGAAIPDAKEGRSHTVSTLIMSLSLLEIRPSLGT